MSDKIKVQVSIEGRWRAGGVVEMTREQYEMLGARLDARPRGYERERLSEEIMDACRIELLSGNHNGAMNMVQEERISGECGECGEPVTLVKNSKAPTSSRDGNRYIYPDREDMQRSGWCIFRCRGCSGVIDENWRPLQAAIAA